MNVRETRSDHQEWTIQRHWQHWVHRTQAEDKQNQKHNNDRHDNVVPFLGGLRSITGTNHKKITSPI